jgi:hypothetical protein
MKYGPKIHQRRSMWLRGYDYSSPGAYYVTLCSFGKGCIFGRVVDDQMQENECSAIVREQWFASAQIRRELELDAFTVMPNHLPGILWQALTSKTNGRGTRRRVGPNAVRPYTPRQPALPARLRVSQVTPPAGWF